MLFLVILNIFQTTEELYNFYFLKNRHKYTQLMLGSSKSKIK